MNKAILMGRLTRDPEIRYTQGDNPMCIARYTLAVDRRFNRNAGNDGNNADFIPCVCFGKTAEFVEKYLKKGTKMAVTGRIQTGSYTNRDGVKVYTTEVVVEDQEFAESKNASGNGSYGGNGGYNGGNNNGGGSSRGGNYGGRAEQAPAQDAGSSDSLDGFMNIPDGIDEELPFA
jgi:single-strand DNA-binding protein